MMIPGEWNRKWTTRDGQRIRVRDMTDSHLENARNWCLENAGTWGIGGFDAEDEPWFEPAGKDGLDLEDWASLFEREIKRRKRRRTKDGHDTALQGRGDAAVPGVADRG
jgi:hypothetical protein